MRVLLLMVVLSFSHLVLAQEQRCPVLSAAQSVDCSRIPNPSLRDDLFRCAQLGDYVRDLDTLDRDMLFMRARLLDFSQLRARKTEQVQAQVYAEFIPDESLQALIAIVSQYCSGAE